MITNDIKKSAAVLAIAALLSFSSGTATFAAGEISISGAASGTDVLAENGSATVIGSFSPDLDLVSSANAELEQSATSSTVAYYGVDVTSATSSPDVHWRITIDHASEALASGDVTIEEVATYNATGGQVRSSPATYNAAETSGDLVLDGNVTGWNLSSGAAFTNIDRITFASDAPLGTYTVTRALINESTGAAFDAPFSFTIDLMAAATSTGGTGTTTGTTTPDTTGTTTPPTTGTTTAATSSPIITLSGDAEVTAFMCNGFVEPGFTAVTSAGDPISASSTSSTGALDITKPGSYTITYTDTDDFGHTATSTRTVVVRNCSAGSGSGGGSGISRAASVTPSGSTIPGNAFGLNALQSFLLPPGQVLGASTLFPGIPATGGIFQFTSDLSIGMRGEEIAVLQERLSETGYFKGPVTGYFGPLTRSALMRLQRANGLSATGTLNAETRMLLNS